jgi:hypothetical protein
VVSCGVENSSSDGNPKGDRKFPSLGRKFQDAENCIVGAVKPWSAGTAHEIPRPVGENTGLRDDAAFMEIASGVELAEAGGLPENAGLRDDAVFISADGLLLARQKA